MKAIREHQRWCVFAGLAGRAAFVKAFSAKVFAESEAKRLRLQYPDSRATFWASRAILRPNAKWADLEPQLSRDGVAFDVFGASTRKQADDRARSAVRTAIRDQLAFRRTDPSFSFLPYTIPELIDHISAQFRPGMSWANYCSEWHIDHIHPRAAFDMRDPDQLAKCWALTNLQPLWAAENSAKGTADKLFAA